MDRVLIAMLSLSFILAPATPAYAHYPGDGCRDFQQEAQKMEPEPINWAGAYTIVLYDFEFMDWQGWTRIDNTAELDEFWHIDDFAPPVGPGNYGLLMPIDGDMSMWCGAAPGGFHTSHWETAPGYGNNWNQVLVSDWFLPCKLPGEAVIIHLDYMISADIEFEVDYLHVEYLDQYGNWQNIFSYTGRSEPVPAHDTVIQGYSPYWTRLRFRFASNCGGSDEDGVHDSDGAAIIDNIVISDQCGVIDTETFETVLYAKESDSDGNGFYWRAENEEPFGLYSGLYNNLLDYDPCCFNYSSQMTFFVGSPYPSGYPGLYDTPFCTGPGGVQAPCHDEMVISPVIDMTKHSTNEDEFQDADIPPGDLPGLCGAQLRFSVYRDLKLSNLVFYYWRVRNIDMQAGIPGPWRDRSFVYYGPDRDCYNSIQDIGDLVANDPMQVAIGCIDMCGYWYDCPFGDCIEHTPSPYIDNVSIIRYPASTPQWSYRDIDLFQDNFTNNWYSTEYIRADMAKDISGCDDPRVLPGDSIVVSVASPCCGEIATEPNGDPRVFMHVRARYIGCEEPPKPDLSGPELEGDYGTYVSHASGWTIIRGERAVSSTYYEFSTNTCCPVDDKYAFDLNDELFTRGYLIEYFFSAYDECYNSSTLPADADMGEYFEFTCLPTMCSYILYVDDFDARGTFDGAVQQYYYDQTFKSVLPPDNQPDRYDVKGPSSLVSNGLGGRATFDHLAAAYRKIIWDSGDLTHGTISDGLRDKSDDCHILLDWLDYSDHDVGLWVLGDNVAYDLCQSPSPSAEDLLDMCGIGNVYDSYYEETGGDMGGGMVEPQTNGLPGSPFYIGGTPDVFCVIGDCEVYNRFDCLVANGIGSYALEYGLCQCNDEWIGSGYYGGVWTDELNQNSHVRRTLWFGFSLMYLRDCYPASPFIRNVVIDHGLQFLGGETSGDITGDDTPPAFVTYLAQNHPNPFNPVTTIKFGVRERGVVKIRIYNASGQLITTLIDEVFDPGTYARDWKGDNDRGAAVASGIYFYRMETKNFSKTRKMILLR